MTNCKTLREICDLLCVSRRVIQGYENAGLVAASDKNKYGHLLYDEIAQERIGKIRLYQQFGFKIKEILKIIDAPSMEVKDVIEKKILRLKEEELKIEILIKKAYELIGEIDY